MLVFGKKSSCKPDPKTILRLWAPLQANWLMMALEGPFLAAVIARLADPTVNLAAYGLAFSFALIAEAPIIMMLSAANALVRDRIAYEKLRRFTNLLNVTISLGLVLFLLTPVFDLVTGRWMELPADLAELTRQATLLLLPWPAAIGYRRFYHGLLIRRRLAGYVAWGTVIRLGSMALTALICYQGRLLPGALAGAAALSVGVVVEAAASRWMARGVVKDLKNQAEEECTFGRNLSRRAVLDFYLPLAMTSLVTLGLHPLVSFFVSRSQMPIESLAVLPVINSLVFIFRSPAMAYQEAAIALLDEKLENRPAVDRFGLLLGLAAALVFSLVVWTPLSTFWFGTASGLSPFLAAFALGPARLLTLLPFLEAWISLQRALRVRISQTRPVINATFIQAASVFLLLFLLVSSGRWIGAQAAALAQVCGYLAANVFLLLFPLPLSLRK